MKTLLAVVLLLAACAVANETYPEEYDHLDVDALLKDQEKVTKFVTCLLKDECTELAGKLKGEFIRLTGGHEVSSQLVYLFSSSSLLHSLG